MTEILASTLAFIILLTLFIGLLILILIGCIDEKEKEKENNEYLDNMPLDVRAKILEYEYNQKFKFTRIANYVKRKKAKHIEKKNNRINRNSKKEIK